MTDILPDCVNMVSILTDLYKKNCLTREEYISHARLKIMFLSERLGYTRNIFERRCIVQTLKNCCDAVMRYEQVIQ